MTTSDETTETLGTAKSISDEVNVIQALVPRTRENERERGRERKAAIVGLPLHFISFVFSLVDLFTCETHCSSGRHGADAA